MTKGSPKGYFDGYSKSVTNKNANKISLSGAKATITPGP